MKFVEAQKGSPLGTVLDIHDAFETAMKAAGAEGGTKQISTSPGVTVTSFQGRHEIKFGKGPARQVVRQR